MSKTLQDATAAREALVVAKTVTAMGTCFKHEDLRRATNRPLRVQTISAAVGPHCPAFRSKLMLKVAERLLVYWLGIGASPASANAPLESTSQDQHPALFDPLRCHSRTQEKEWQTEQASAHKGRLPATDAGRHSRHVLQPYRGTHGTNQTESNQ